MWGSSHSLAVLAVVSGCGSIKKGADGIKEMGDASKSVAATLDRLAGDVKLESEDWKKQLQDAEQTLTDEHKKARDFIQSLVNDVTAKVWAGSNCAAGQVRQAIGEDLRAVAAYLGGGSTVVPEPSPVVCDSSTVTDDFNGEIKVLGYHFLQSTPVVQIPLADGSPYILPASAVLARSDYVLSINTTVEGVRPQLPNGDQLNFVWPASTHRPAAIPILHDATACIRNVPAKDVCEVCKWTLSNELEFRGDPVSGKGPPFRVFPCPKMAAGTKFKATLTPSTPMLIQGNAAASFTATAANYVQTTSPSAELEVDGTVDDKGLVVVQLGLDTHGRTDAVLKTPKGMTITVVTTH